MSRNHITASIFSLIVVVAAVSSAITWSLSNQPSSHSMPSVLRCSGNDLSSFEQHQGAGGSMYVSVIFLNTSKRRCSLSGFPSVTLYNSAGLPMAHEAQKNSPSIPSRRVTLMSGGVAGFIIQFSDGSVPGVDPPDGCRAATSAQVRLPHVRENGQPFIANFSIPLAPCDGGGFEVTALQKGQPLP
jgi:hypothetical protein